MKKLLLKTMLLLCAIVGGVSSAWATSYTELFNISSASVVSGSSYKAHTAIVSERGFVITFGGNNNSIGTNSSNRSSCNLSSYAKYAISPVTTSSVASAFATTTSISNVSKISYTFSGGSNQTNTKVYLLYSSDNITFSKVSLTSGTQGATISSGTAFEFSALTGYFALLFEATNSSGNWRIDTVIARFYEVSSGSSSTCETPTFDPVGGTYTSAQSVGINCGTDGATIHYTTNGDDPTESDATYSSAVSITTSGTVLKAKAFKDGYNASSVASATYTIKPNKPTVSAAGATVTISGDDGLTFYYTTDGSAPSNSSTEYTAPFDLTEDCTIKAKAYDAYGNASDASTAFKFKYMPLSPKNIGSGYYEKVTDVSSLENGDAILIVNEGEGAALGPQSGNNCPGKAVTISTGVISNKGDAQKLILVKKTEKIDDEDTDVFYFYTGSAYLYASSGSSNQLKTEATPDDNNNARATIAISSGNATILFTGTNSRKWLKYNSNNGSPLFSCYKSDDSSMELVQIYKEVAHNETLNPAKEYTTLTSAYNLNFTSVSSVLKAYIATEISAGKVQMTQVNKVPANTGLVLKATTPNSPVNVPVFDGTSADDVSGNKMAGSATETTAIAENGGYILSNGVFQPASAGTLAAGKAYLNIAVSAGAHELTMNFGDETDGLQTLSNSPLKGENIYNLAGQRLQKMQRGINIVNGRKVVNK